MALWSRKPGDQQMAANGKSEQQAGEQAQVIKAQPQNVQHPSAAPAGRPDQSGASTDRRPQPPAESTLDELEKRVTVNRKSWAPMGRDLGEIKRRGLHCERGKDWDGYVREMWGITGRQADNAIRGASIAPSLHIDHACSLGAVLTLGRVDASKRTSCLREAITTSGSRSPSAREVRRAVAKLAGPAKAKADKRRRAGKLKPEKHPHPLGRIEIVPGKRVVIVARKAGDDLPELTRVALSKLTSPPQADAA